MINLLPPDKKRQILAGQSNVLLVRYNFATLLLAVLLAVISIAFYLNMLGIQNTAKTSISEGSARNAQYSSTEQAATEFKNNLSVAKTILDKEVRYTNIAIKIAQALPRGIVLQSLELNSQSFGTPMTLTAHGKSQDDALRLKSELSASSVFEDVHILTMSTVDDAPSEHPVAITISVTINPEVLKS